MSDSESSSSYESSSEDDLSLLARPVFLKKSKKDSAASPEAGSKSAISRAEFQQQLDAKEAKVSDFGSVSDTDDVDPDSEYAQWKLRELQRRQRDRQKLESIEKEKEDQLRRKKGTFKEVDHTSDGASKEKEASKESDGHKKLGIFYGDGIDEKLLKRDYTSVEDSGDHSRPTKYMKHKMRS
ncbi:hypothetical protein A9F13_01g08283 [Clavispora lusitaniae]|uniref:Micro-fibrillar-associated protein 1 C-terminal domain-containing protein n=1 Tax=Clavispora lusitaniae TaxID=36911 RepID=A0AA91T4J8_CLALS|nr:hypothetical protein A9F13_01g08283 [Clavispora lusitaniae]